MTGIQLHLLQSLGWAVLNSLWQMALLWVIYMIVIAISKNLKNSSKSILASGLLFAGFLWFVYTFIIVYNKIITGEAVGESVTISSGTYSWLLQSLPFISRFSFIILFTGTLSNEQVIRKYGLTKINVDWKIFVRNVAARMGIKKPVQIWVSEFVSSPVTIGFLKPVILVPLAAISHLTPHQLEAVLLHELAHIRRYDYLVNLLINFIQTILYFNPFVKAFVKIVEREREKSCDEMVLQFQYDSHQYASALLLLEKTNYQQKALIISAGGNKNDLLHRIETIIGIQKKQTLSANKIAGLLSAIICILALNLLLLLPGKESNRNKTTAYSEIFSPFSFITEGAGEQNDEAEAGNKKSALTIFDSKNLAATTDVQSPATPIEPPPNTPLISEQNLQDISSLAYKLAGFEEVNIPVLKKYQEQQVKDALAASKKVLESSQWKLVEKSIADAFSEREKEEIKSVYEKELDKFDWNKWENKLKLAYDNIDWDKVNNQLSNAINQIRVDSLQRVYNDVAVKLNAIEKELSLNKVKSIPDTDISLKTVEEKKTKVQQTLNTLKAIRNKKIVHL